MQANKGNPTKTGSEDEKRSPWRRIFALVSSLLSYWAKCILSIALGKMHPTFLSLP